MMNIKAMLTRRFYVALLILLLTGYVFKVSYFQESSEAYLFPSIVAGLMLILSMISFVREAFDLCVDDFKPIPFVSQIYAIIVMILGVAVAEWLGMYVTTCFILLFISYRYSNQEVKSKRIANSVLFSAGFIGLIYVLFSVMLNLQLPRGVLI